MKKVYLAGPIFKCEDHECIEWRNQAQKGLEGFQVFDPMNRDYRGKTDQNYIRIVEEDKAHIDDCDILLVNHFKPSVGTSMEVLYAWERGIKVYAVCPDGETSPWLLYHTHQVFKTLAGAIEHIKNET